MDLVRLTLEAKMLQWKNEQLPIVHQLIDKHNNLSGQLSQSLLLDVWHVWEKEMDQVSLDFCCRDMMRLADEAETLSEDSCKDGLSLEHSLPDDTISSSLMNDVITYLLQLQDIHLQSYPEVIDINDMERLQHEAFLLS